MATSSSDETLMPIVVSSTIIICLTVSAVTLICIFRPGDNTQMIINIIGFATMAITSLMAVIKAVGTGKAIDTLTEKTDGKLNQLIEAKTANATMAENIRMTDLAKAPGTTTTITTNTFEPQPQSHTEPPTNPS